MKTQTETETETGNKEKEGRTIPERSVDVQLLVRRLELLEPGDRVGYGELAEVAGCTEGELRGRRRHLLDSARRVLLHEQQRVIECVWGEGLRRLRAEEVPSAGVQAVERVQRAARTGLKKLATVDPMTLSAGARVQHDLTTSVLGLVRMSTRRQALAQVEARVSAGPGKLNFEDVVAIFRKRPPAPPAEAEAG